MALTYDSIASQTVSGTSTTTITFSSIPSTYTDLVLIKSGEISATGNTFMRVNGDSGSNYSTTNLYGDGTSAASNRGTNEQSTSVGYSAAGAGIITHIINLNNYANTTTNKTFITRSNSAGTGGYVEARIGLWRSTAAINSITLFLGSGYFVAGTTFSLFGIKAA